MVLMKLDIVLYKLSRQEINLWNPLWIRIY